MNGDYQSFLSLPEQQDRRDVFEAAARRLDTLPSYVEKDFGVCLVLDTLYNKLPDGILIYSSRVARPCPRPSGSSIGSLRTSISSLIVMILALKEIATQP